MICFAALLLACSPPPVPAHVLFLTPANSERTVAERSEEIRDQMPLEWLRKGIAPLSARHFQDCPHQTSLDAIETCARPIWRAQSHRDGNPVILVLAEPASDGMIHWRCVGDRRSANARISRAGPLDPVQAADARHCLMAAAGDLPSRIRQP